MHAVGAFFLIEQVEPGDSAIAEECAVPGIDAIKMKCRKGRLFGLHGLRYVTFNFKLNRRIG